VEVLKYFFTYLNNLHTFHRQSSVIIPFSKFLSNLISFHRMVLSIVLMPCNILISSSISYFIIMMIIITTRQS